MATRTAAGSGFTAPTWVLLSAQSIVVAGALHLIMAVQTFETDVLFIVLTFGISPAQLLFGAVLRRGVHAVDAVLAAAAAVALVVLYLYCHTAVLPSGRGINVAGTLVLGGELVAVSRVGALLSDRLLRWLTRGLLCAGLLCCVVWFAV